MEDPKLLEKRVHTLRETCNRHEEAIAALQAGSNDQLLHHRMAELEQRVMAAENGLKKLADSHAEMAKHFGCISDEMREAIRELQRLK